MSRGDLVCLDDIVEAQRCIGTVVRRTPLLPFDLLDADARFLLKAEHTQLLGSFKIRGALNAVRQLPPDRLAAGIVAFSSGNHGKAVAFAAKELGAHATVVMPTTAPAVKVDAVRALGAQVELVAPERRDTYPHELVARTGAVLVHPFDSAAAIAGHGSIGLELLDQVPDLAAVLVPVSGGGLISGIAAAIKRVRPTVRVIGVEPELAGDAAESVRLGRRVSWPESRTYRTIADGLRASRVGELPWRHLEALVDDVVTVTEEEIVDAARQLVRSARQVVEPSGAVATAAWLHGRVAAPADGRVVAMLSGGNVAPEFLADVLSG